MKKFLVKCLVFGVVLFGLAAGLDYVLCRGLLKMEDYRFQDYAAMLKGEMDNDILIMGNSRGKSHYDTAIVDSLGNASSFCIGVGGYPLTVHHRLQCSHSQQPKSSCSAVSNLQHASDYPYPEDHGIP